MVVVLLWLQEAVSPTLRIRTRKASGLYYILILISPIWDLTSNQNTNYEARSCQSSVKNRQARRSIRSTMELSSITRPSRSCDICQINQASLPSNHPCRPPVSALNRMCAISSPPSIESFAASTRPRSVHARRDRRSTHLITVGGRSVSACVSVCVREPRAAPRRQCSPSAGQDQPGRRATTTATGWPLGLSASPSVRYRPIQTPPVDHPSRFQHPPPADKPHTLPRADPQY